MRKFCLTLAGLFFSLILVLPVHAAQIYSDGFFQYHVYEGYNSICGYFGSEKTVTVPSSIAGRPVSRIEAGAFDGCSTIEKLVLPDTIMEIEDNAFSGAKNLKTIEDASGVWSKKKAEDEGNGSGENGNGIGDHEYTETGSAIKPNSGKTEDSKSESGKTDVSRADSGKKDEGIETEIIKDGDNKTEEQSEKGDSFLILKIVFAVVTAGAIVTAFFAMRRKMKRD